MRKAFPYLKQLNSMECGPTCLRMIAQFYGKRVMPGYLRKITSYGKRGVSLLSLVDSAAELGFDTTTAKLSMEELKQIGRPCILHWDQKHFVVYHKYALGKHHIVDPARGKWKYDTEAFEKHWITDLANKGAKGIALIVCPSDHFTKDPLARDNEGLAWREIRSYFSLIRPHTGIIFATLLFTAMFQLMIPFLTKSIVDSGISNGDLNFILIILFGQIMLTLSQAGVEFIRTRLLLKVSNMLSIQLISNFWIKLCNITLDYFETRKTGDTLQRINDHKKLQAFLTGSALSTLFSVVSFLIYSYILIFYTFKLFVVFVIGSILYVCWIRFFFKLRRKVNHELFDISAKESDCTLQFIQGMRDIRLNVAEQIKRKEWVKIQLSFFKINFRNLSYNQLQSAGATLITQIQGLVITYLTAKAVIAGELSFGSMLAIQYIIGQMSGPVQQWIGSIQNFQDTKISVERINDVYAIESEKENGRSYVQQLPEQFDIVMKNLSFAYPGMQDEPVLKNINLTIPAKKVTAIVGSSGSGKTTILKLLLKIYPTYEGSIRLETPMGPIVSTAIDFDSIEPEAWRINTGAVLQDGYIFMDTIENNIVLGSEKNTKHLIQCCTLANIHDFIDSLPQKYNSVLGMEGVGISQGQRQRILIARALYKNPTFILFDEATNALDAVNERIIVDNLKNAFENKTVVIVAHRLSTVKFADKIVVLENGKILEEGNHHELISLQQRYFDLVKNQMS